MSGDAYGFKARLARPKWTVYDVADPARPLRVGLNQYRGLLGSATIGLVVVWRSRCFSLVWARPRTIAIRPDGRLWEES